MAITKISKGLDVTSDYAFTGTVSGAGSLNLLNTTDFTTATANVDFDNTLITDDYNDYVLIASHVIPATDGTEPYIQVSTDNGSTIFNNNDSCRIYINLTTAQQGQERQTGNFIQLATDLGNDANLGGSYIIEFTGLRNDDYKWGTYRCSAKHNNAAYSWHGGFSMNTTSIINFIRFKMSSGNISQGKFSLYGVSR